MRRRHVGVVHRAMAPQGRERRRRIGLEGRRQEAEVDGGVGGVRSIGDGHGISSSGNSNESIWMERSSTARRVAGQRREGLELAEAEQQDEERLDRDLAVASGRAIRPAGGLVAVPVGQEVRDLGVALGGEVQLAEEPAGLGEARGGERVHDAGHGGAALGGAAIEAVERPPAGFHEELGLVAEVVVDGGRRHPGAGRDVGHRGAAIAVLDARRHGRGQQTLTRRHAVGVDLRRPASGAALSDLGHEEARLTIVHSARQAAKSPPGRQPRRRRGKRQRRGAARLGRSAAEAMPSHRRGSCVRLARWRRTRRRSAAAPTAGCPWPAAGTRPVPASPSARRAVRSAEPAPARR